MRRVLVLAMAVAGVWACGPTQHEIPVLPGGDAGCATTAAPCGGVCCAADERCTADGQCCKPDCAGKSCGDDGCGGSCGSCAEGWACNADKGSCECAADETDEAFCARLGRACGPASGKDGCGRDRAVASCGSCNPGWTCNATEGQCECPAESDTAFCARMGVACGTATGTDTCGTARTAVDCDRCKAPETCDKVSGTCRCVPEDAAALCGALGTDCGPVAATDHCGTARTLDCGECDPGFTCGATNRCVVCVNETVSELCARLGVGCGAATGTDNCRDDRTVDCGGCQAGFQCDAATTHECVVCAPETDAAFCARLGNLTCGTATGTDNCGLPRTTDCGTCTGTDWCDPTNHCRPCVPETDPALCGANGKECGSLTAVDLCGATRAIADCGACGPVEQCDATGTCVVCAPETDSELCAYYFKNCGSPLLLDNCGLSRTPTCGGASCSAGLTCQPDSVCGNGTTPTNDTCANPERIVFDVNGDAVGSGDTSLGTDDYSGSCGGGYGGKDLLYAFTLAAQANVTVTVTAGTGGSSALQPLVYIRSGAATGGCGGSGDVVCGHGALGGNLTITARALAAGDYFLVVDGYGANNGPFSFTITHTPVPPPPANDTCAAPAVLTFVGDTATATGDTTNATNDYADRCVTSVMDGPDLVYQMTLTADSAVTITVTRDPTAVVFLPAVEVASACPGSTARLACATETAGTGAAMLYKSLVPAGDYYVVVDGTSGTYGPFTLEVKTSPSPVFNDLCSGASDVPLLAVPGSTDLVGAVAGDTTLAADDYSGSCVSSASGTGGDLVYKFTTTAVQNVKVDLAAPASSGLSPSLYVRSSCQPDAAEKGCAYSVLTGATLTLQLQRLPAGTYYVFVDGYQPATNGPFTLFITASVPSSPAAPNDTCSGPTVLPLTNGWAHLEDSTSQAQAGDEYEGSCATSSHPFNGGDLTYSVTTPAQGTLAARVRRKATGAALQPAVYIESACGDTRTERACGYDLANNGTAVATASSVPAGTYSVVVDGVNATFGDFALDVVFYTDPGPDDCAGARLLSVDANGEAGDTGDTCALASDMSNLVANSCTSVNSGNDAVYKLVTTAAKNLKVAFDPGHSGASYVYLQTACGTTSSQLLCSQTTGGTSNVLRAKNLPAGTYYVWLDNAYPACGPYDVSFQLTDAPAAPANDLCLGATAITIDATTGIGSVSGSTDSASDDTAGSCALTTGGPDVFYSFTLSGTPKAVDIQVTPAAGSDLKPVIYLQSTCGAASTESLCKAINAPGQTAELQYPRLGAGTYYLVVDSSERNATGAFTVAITTSPAVQAAANDLCANATAMPAIDPTTKTTSITGNTLNGNNDDTSYCATSTTVFNGPDLVYSFVLPADSLVTAKVTRAAGNATYKPALSLRRTCALADEVACGNDSAASPTGLAKITNKALAAGTWYLVVDGLDSSFGPFTLDVTQGSAAVAGDACGNALALAFTANVATVTGDLTTTGLTNDYADTTCSTTTSVASDVVYSFTTTADEFVTVSMGPGGTRIGPAVYLRTACNDASSEIGCAYTTTSGGTSSFSTSRLPPGTYYVFADAYTTSFADTYRLTVTLTDPVNSPPVNDTCRTATPVGLNSNNEAHLTGDTRDAHDDYGGTGVCGVSNTSVGRLSGGDVVYVLSVAQGSTLTASVKGDPTTASYVPAVYLRSNCGSAAPADQLACDYSPTTGSTRLAGVTATNLAAGSYYIIVDGKAGTAGLFNLDIYVRPNAISNASCATASPVLFDTSTPGQAVATVLGDTALGSAATAGIQQGSQSCFSTGKELYYYFTTGTVQDLVAVVSPLSATYAPTVYLRSNCGDASSQVGCNYNSTGGGLVNLTKLRLPAGSYALVVDSASTTAVGPFSLQLTLSDPPPPPANDTCRGATVLTLPASGAQLTFSGSTLPAANDYVGGCQTASQIFDGPDVVYSLTPTANTQVTASAVAKSTSQLKVAVYLRSNCAAVSDDVCKFNQTAASPTGATIAASLKAGTTYYLIVDGIGGTAGDFDLTLAVDNAKYLDGDNCTDPIALDPLFAPNPTNPNEMIATVSGNTANAFNDADVVTCRSGTGGDFVYTFTLTQESVVAITAGPNGTSSYAPTFHLRTTCGAPLSELYCAYNGMSAAKSASVNKLPPGFYYLFVDSYYTTNVGPFTATVAIKPTPVQTAANDTCATATRLTFNPGTGTSQVATVTGEDSSFAGDDAQGLCYLSHGAELVYTFTTTAAQSFAALVTPDSGQTMFKPVVYLRNVCNQSADSAELGCKQQTAGGSSLTLSINSIPAGTYWLYVDNFQASPWDQPGGKYTVKVTLDAVAATAPPANDNCTGAQPIALAGQAPSVTTVTGQTTLGATNDTFGAGGTCYAGYGTSGGDVVYYFDLTSPAKVDAKVTFSASNAYPVVYLRSSCNFGTLACNYVSSGNNVTATATYLPAGRYWLWIDGYSAMNSNFQIDLTLNTPTGTPPPSNFMCSGPLPALTKAVPVSGTTVGSQNSNAPLGIACSGTSTVYAPGPNVVYTYTPAATEFFVVSLLTTGSSDLLVWMSDKCLDGPSCLAYNNSGNGSGQTDAFGYYGKAGVTYYIVVDSTTATYAGTYVLTVN